MKNKPLFMMSLAFVAVFIALFAFSYQDQQPQQEVVTQQAQTATSNQNLPKAPPFNLQDLDGNVVSLDDYRGKVLFINFWATWCGPCRQEIPHFVELVDKYGDDGFAILGISVDNPRDFEKLPAFADQYNINYPILLGNQNVSMSYGGVQNIPTTFVINREGFAVGRIIGARPYDQFESIIKELL